MDDGSSKGSEVRFAAYVEALGAVPGHVDRQQPMHDYCLWMRIARKSVEPMAAVTAPAHVAGKHQSLRHFIGNAPCRTPRCWPRWRTGAAGNRAQRAGRGLDHRRHGLSKKGGAQSG